MNTTAQAAAMPTLDTIENADGSVTIPLRKPLDVDGAKVMHVTMREPLVEDQMAAEMLGGGAAAIEVRLIANLCMLAEPQVKKLTSRDYGRIQKVLTNFLA